MKKAFLLLITAAAAVATANAQPFRLGLHGGVSLNTVPTRSFDAGDNNTINYTTGLSFHYNITERWQVGAEAALTRWKTMSTVQLVADNGNPLGNQDVSFVIAERAASLAFEFNHVIPITQQYDDYVPGELSFGVAAGVVATGGDGEIVYDRVNPRTPREYVYRKELHYESGYGYLFGAQIGYSHYFSPRIGIDLNLKGRWTAVQTIDPRYGARNQRYDIFWFPATIGIKFRLGSDDSMF